MVAPRSGDSYYRETYNATLNFQAECARLISETNIDSVIIIADQNTIAKFRSIGVPNNILKQGNVQDIWVRDFGLVGMNENQQQAFVYSPNYLGSRESKNIQKSFLNFLKSKSVSPQGMPDVIMDGGSLVDNGVDTAFITTRVYKDKFRKQSNQEVRVGIKKALDYSNLIVLEELTGDTTGHADGMVSFIDTRTVAITDLDDKDYIKIENQVTNAGLKPVHLNSVFKDEYWKKFSSSCGLHVNLLSTESVLYVPVFGNDEANRMRGQSLAKDNEVVGMIERNTRKKVIRIPVPHDVCKMGGSVRCFTMAIKGPSADRLIK